MASPPDVRPEPPTVGPESEMLTTWLDYQRATLLWKCAGVAPTDLVRPCVPTSSLTLLGLVRHMTLVEWSWFEERFTATSVTPPFPLDDDIDADFNDLDVSRVEEDFAGFARQCEASRAVVAGAESFDQLAKATKVPMTLRWIVVHMIEEYSRHNGHADLLREAIDGVVGE